MRTISGTGAKVVGCWSGISSDCGGVDVTVVGCGADSLGDDMGTKDDGCSGEGKGEEELSWRGSCWKMMVGGVN